MAEIKIGSPLYDSQYVVDKNLGSGMDGDVYIVHHIDFPETKYAAKVFKKPEKIDDEYWRKRGDETLTAIRISQKPNPNLMTTYNVHVTKDNDIILIMDYIDGITLRTYLAQQGCLTPKVALNIFKKLLNGIKQLHSYRQKIIHRDLKPENIMVSHDLSRVVIVDFGISSVVKQDIDKVITNEIELYGTASYILPDLLSEFRKKPEERKISVQSDFYSLGIILYEMIMGTLPYQPVNTGNEKKDKLATIRIPNTYDMVNISANPTIPASLENIIFRCIATKPEDKKYRYEEANQIIDDVNKCLLIIDKKSDPTPLLKPISRRFYQYEKQIDIDRTKSEQR